MSALRSQFPGLAVGWAVMFSAVAANATPPVEQTVSVWSDEYRYISPESGARITGRWKTSVAPYMRRPMDVSGVDHPCGSVWLRWSAKTGKTQVFLNSAMHCIDTAPRSAMVVCASDQKQKDFEKEVFSPNIRASPKVGLKIMAVKAGAENSSTKYHKRFRGGFLKIANAGSEAQLQQSDIGLLIFEEPSSYPRDVGGRGSPIRQGRTRTLAWGDDAKELGGGTPKFVGDCPVTVEIERRTHEKYYVPCPHCNAKQLLLWENMQCEGGRPFFICQSNSCGEPIGHEHKRWMLDQADAGNGGWLACFQHQKADGTPDLEHPNIPPPPCIEHGAWEYWLGRRGPDCQGALLEGRDPSFDGIWQAYSPFTTWSRIFVEFDEAMKSDDPEALVTFWQQVLGLPFEAAYDRPATARLYEKRTEAAAIAMVERGRIPPWAWTVFLAVDVQGDRLEWAVWVVGPAGPLPEGAKGRRYARIDSGIIPIPPVDPRAWSEMADITKRTYEGDACRPIGFDRVGVDTGGHHTNRAYVFCMGRPNVMALKGASEKEKKQTFPIEAGTRRKAKVGRRVVGEVQLYLVGTHGIKKEIYFGLAQTLAGVELGEHLPGSVTLEGTASELDFQQMTAEVLLPPDPSKKPPRKYEIWEPVKGVRNEQLDMAVYCHAIAWSFLPDVMTEEDWKRLIAERRREPSREGQLPLEGLWSGAPALPPANAPAAAPERRSPPPADDPVENVHPLLKLARDMRGT
ncbi:phage terminase large subunit family protein [Caulobacter sp. SL161]|uniref:terminase gpA endonuclease subunit n=1 Tax=Caulobacter sp. SL161 TaxID=2995156 RepID=UPI0022769E7B|nr:terminase gpA endonuclease subunit [Caulobacter sp. SL161]MCY1649085.1 phage terminase large subunit family protein [Caulobacter sp. SL161]